MIAQIAPRPSGPAAADVLRQVFGGLQVPIAFRLWDGTTIRVGGAPPVVTIVIHKPETFAQLMDDPSPGHFAEAYVASDVDFEGDLFEMMRAANEADSLHLTVGQKLGILWMLLRDRWAPRARVPAR
jgi:hypothetical protein